MVMTCYRGDFGVYYIRVSMPVPCSYHLAQRRAVGHERIPVIRYGRCGSDDSTLERDGQLGAQEHSRTSQMLQLGHTARSVSVQLEMVVVVAIFIDAEYAAL